MTGQQYTPDTATVREVYYAAPGNRDWEAARAASFDRWLDAHDAEVRAVQPPPPPPREQIAEAIRNSDWDSLGNWDAEPDRIKEDYRRNADAVLALLPQPTPSAEPCTCPPPATHLGEGPDQDCPKHGDRFHIVEPPSIADMAPETDAEFRTTVHAAVRKGMETFTGEPARRELVRAIADQVLAVPLPSATPEGGTAAG